MKLTVFTPTFNRGYIIHQLYHSLQRQTYDDFEWLVVDDGSTDNTEDLFKTWIIENNKFSIRYYKKKNGGKGRAINYGLDLAKGVMFFNVDSDDYLTDNALEKIINWEKNLPKNEMFCGVVGNLGTSEDKTPNSPLKSIYRDSNLLERYSEYTKDPIDGERAYVFYTEIFKKYKYPEFDGENFITPAVTWNRMAHDGYKVRIFDDIIWIYKYQADGLTAAGNKNFLNNPQGHGLWLREKAKFINYSFVKKIKMYYSYYCDHKNKLSEEKIAKYIGTSKISIYLIKIIYIFKHII